MFNTVYLSASSRPSFTTLFQRQLSPSENALAWNGSSLREDAFRIDTSQNEQYAVSGSRDFTHIGINGFRRTMAVLRWDRYLRHSKHREESQETSNCRR